MMTLALRLRVGLLLTLIVALNPRLVISWKLWVLNIVKEEFELAFARDYLFFRQERRLALSSFKA
jgi:hypothetical protein